MSVMGSYTNGSQPELRVYATDRLMNVGGKRFREALLNLAWRGTCKMGILFRTQWSVRGQTFYNANFANCSVQSWAKKWSLGCENCLPDPAWLLLSKAGTLFGPFL